MPAINLSKGKWTLSGARSDRLRRQIIKEGFTKEQEAMLIRQGINPAIASQAVYREALGKEQKLQVGSITTFKKTSPSPHSKTYKQALATQQKQQGEELLKRVTQGTIAYQANKQAEAEIKAISDEQKAKKAKKDKLEASAQALYKIEAKPKEKWYDKNVVTKAFMNPRFYEAKTKEIQSRIRNSKTTFALNEINKRYGLDLAAGLTGIAIMQPQLTGAAIVNAVRKQFPFTEKYKPAMYDFLKKFGKKERIVLNKNAKRQIDISKYTKPIRSDITKVGEGVLDFGSYIIEKPYQSYAISKTLGAGAKIFTKGATLPFRLGASKITKISPMFVEKMVGAGLNIGLYGYVSYKGFENEVKEGNSPREAVAKAVGYLVAIRTIQGVNKSLKQDKVLKDINKHKKKIPFKERKVVEYIIKNVNNKVDLVKRIPKRFSYLVNYKYNPKRIALGKYKSIKGKALSAISKIKEARRSGYTQLTSGKIIEKGNIKDTFGKKSALEKLYNKVGDYPKVKYNKYINKLRKKYYEDIYLRKRNQLIDYRNKLVARGGYTSLKYGEIKDFPYKYTDKGFRLSESGGYIKKTNMKGQRTLTGEVQQNPLIKVGHNPERKITYLDFLNNIQKKAQQFSYAKVGDKGVIYNPNLRVEGYNAKEIAMIQQRMDLFMNQGGIYGRGINVREQMKLHNFLLKARGEQEKQVLTNSLRKLGKEHLIESGVVKRMVERAVVDYDTQLREHYRKSINKAMFEKHVLKIDKDIDLSKQTKLKDFGYKVKKFVKPKNTKIDKEIARRIDEKISKTRNPKEFLKESEHHTQQVHKEAQKSITINRAELFRAIAPRTEYKFDTSQFGFNKKNKDLVKTLQKVDINKLPNKAKELMFLIPIINKKQKEGVYNIYKTPTKEEYKLGITPEVKRKEILKLQQTQIQAISKLFDLISLQKPKKPRRDIKVPINTYRYISRKAKPAKPAKAIFRLPEEEPETKKEKRLKSRRTYALQRVKDPWAWTGQQAYSRKQNIALMKRRGTLFI